MIHTLPPLSKPQPAKHLPALDGLRGWAVVAVMFYHFALPLLDQEHSRASWIVLKLMLTGSYGVDMFFVLSGFLITGILLDSKDSPSYFKTFYLRRTVRIFPLYYGVLAVCFGLLFWMPILQPFVKTQAWLWLYAANFSELAHVSFYPVFSHFWSLAIEEQFYIAWPLVVLVLSRGQLLKLSAGLAIGSLLLRCLLISSGLVDAELAANLTFCRLDGLTIGALLAAAARGRGGLSSLQFHALLLASVGGAATLILKGLFGSTGGSIWSLSGAGHFTISVTVAGILILAVTANGFWSKLLNNSTLRFFGKYSYGLYVFHYLLQPWMDSRFWFVPSVPVVSLLLHMATLTGITVLVSLASWHCYEKQFLKLKKFFEYEKKPTPVTPQEPESPIAKAA